jgi:Tfp pilus assembly PilM family ATPase
MAKKPGTVAAFEWGPSSLKFVEMPRGERRVLSAGIFPLEPGRWRDRGHLAAQVRSALDVASRGKVEQVIASVPIGHAHLRVIETPADDAGGTARDHLAWDMSRYLARPLDLYALDFQPLADAAAEKGGRNAPQARRFAAAAFRRDEAAALRDIVETATGLPLTALDVDAAAVVNAFAAAHPEQLPDRTLIVQANLHAAALIRTRHGEFQGAMLRRDAGEALMASDPVAETQERAEGLQRCARGIAANLTAGEEAWGKPDRVVLCGELSADADFRELLRFHLPVPFTLIDPFATFPGPDAMDYPGAYPGAPLTAAVGLALRLAEER